MKMDAPKPDPSLAVERQRSENERIESTQERLAALTAQYARSFGQRRSLNGGARRPAIAAGV